MATEAQLEAMLFAARAVREHAHAPYSKFKVGAALLDESGRVHAGCNVENAAYPQGLCAEAGALARLVATGGLRVLAVLVVGGGPRWCTPCGGCRQKLREFAGADTPVFMANADALLGQIVLGELLPHSFGPEHIA